MLVSLQPYYIIKTVLDNAHGLCSQYKVPLCIFYTLKHLHVRNEFSVCEGPNLILITRTNHQEESTALFPRQRSTAFLASRMVCLEDNFLPPRPGGWGGVAFRDDSSTLHLLRTLFPILLHHFHLRRSGIRTLRLGEPCPREISTGI